MWAKRRKVKYEAERYQFSDKNRRRSKRLEREARRLTEMKIVWQERFQKPFGELHTEKNRR